MADNLFMEEKQPQTYESFAHRHLHTVTSFVTLVEWLLVAFILALLFQGFAMQAFQIPTGSMAETLRGDHFPIRCTRCGHSFDVGSEAVTVSRAQCPNCDYILPPKAIGQMKNGDRIFVLKSIYQFFQPKRWDVVVFKNPTNPKDNFIKRLIGLPKETVQLIHGDVFIDGQIVRKPVNVQKELWMPIYLQDNRAKVGSAPASNEEPLPPISRFINEPNSAWQFQTSSFKLDDNSGARHSLIYTTDNPHDFRAVYSYNESIGAARQPIVSDLMISFFAFSDQASEIIGASLEKGGVQYSAHIEKGSNIVFERTANGKTQELRRMLLAGPQAKGFQKFEFANVDGRLVLRWAGHRATYDLTKDPDVGQLGTEETQSPAVHIFAKGKTQIRHICLFRDIYYIGRESFQTLRATEDKPFDLKAEQFFVCGDNSNNSYDSRMWNVEGKGNSAKSYDMGVVPLEYMMGKAVMIYWAQALTPTAKAPAIVPNLSNLKLIYGSSKEEY